MVTLGPSTDNVEALKKLKSQNVNFVRANLSHTSIEDLDNFIALANSAQIPFVLDTEGSQVRTGINKTDDLFYNEGDEIFIHDDDTLCDEKNLTLTPVGIIDQLEPGDLIYVDFNSVVISIIDSKRSKDGALLGIVKSAGSTGSNKGVFIDSFMNRRLDMDVITEKDVRAIELGLKRNVSIIALSFVRRASDIRLARELTKGKMKIISKIECVDALDNLTEIIDETDYLLIDRGDLSKEVSIEKIPILQKAIITEALKQEKKTFVATNLLESMLHSKMPTRAEVHDVSQTLISGAGGLILAAETAIGNNPFLCVNMIKKIAKETQKFQLHDKNAMPLDLLRDDLIDKALNNLKTSIDQIEPHGGKLVGSILPFSNLDINKSIPIIKISNRSQMDLEQICTGAYSPLEGFMDSKTLDSVLNNFSLTDDILWPLPILLDVDEEQISTLKVGSSAYLAGFDGTIRGLIEVSEIYPTDKEKLCQHLYNSNDSSHPGVSQVKNMKSYLIAGKVNLLSRSLNDHSRYDITPELARKFFQSKNWNRVVGFHTRNVIHRAHEYIQMQALNRLSADGLFVHPAIGEKKQGDYLPECIISSYKFMSQNVYPKDRTLFSTFSTFSRYAGYRELLFTAICRQNFGCTHFIVGRDHTQSDSDQTMLTKKMMLELQSKMNIKIEFFGHVKFSKSKNQYIESGNDEDGDNLEISGSESREMIKSGEQPPSWFMRDEISELLIKNLKIGKKIFVQ
jgi:pyruvate kinase